MTLRTKDGRPLCEVRDRGSDGPVLWIHPLLYSVLRPIIENKIACTLELHFSNTGLASTHVRVDGERLASTLANPTATLQPTPLENILKVS